jgi:hypothetical protein
MVLSKFCQHLDFDKLTLEEGAPHHKSYANLVESARRGCEICSILRYSKEAREWEMPWESDLSGEDAPITCHLQGDESLSWFQADLDRFIGFMNLCTTDSECFWLLIQSLLQKARPIFGTFLTQNSEASLIWARPIHKDASSDEFFTQVHCLMDTCLEEHPCCQQRPKSRLPTRVIDVGSQERDHFCS